jgi:prepilin-type N-terminal cleavage/methylation domain-containing protein
MSVKTSRGFTLIELLTVIAIIAVLAAILFPVFGQVRENARQATCQSNMSALQTGISLYRQDNSERYPPLLLGYAERPDGTPWQVGDTVAPVAPNQLKHSPLYPNYIKNLDTFRCPDNPKNVTNNVVQAVYPSTSPWSTKVSNVTFGSLGMAPGVLPASYQNVPVSYYDFDSYDITIAIGADGKKLNPNTMQCVYTQDWTSTAGKQDSPYQLKYRRTPPDGRIVLTWCNYHTAVAGRDKTLVAPAGGKVRTISYKSVLNYGYGVFTAP